MVQSMNGSSNKMGQLLIREDLCVEHAADADGGDEDMHLPEFAGLRIHQKLRLVTGPVDVHSLSGDPFHGHTQRTGAVVRIDIQLEVMAELGVLIARRIRLLIPEPHIVQIGLAAS